MAISKVTIESSYDWKFDREKISCVIHVVVDFKTLLVKKYYADIMLESDFIYKQSTTELYKYVSLSLAKCFEGISGLEGIDVLKIIYDMLDAGEGKWGMENLLKYKNNAQSQYAKYLVSGEAKLYSSSDSVSKEALTLPGMQSILVCPGCGNDSRRKQTLYTLVQHLNDDHKWAREKIADWLDEQHDSGIINIEFQPWGEEPKQEDTPEPTWQGPEINQVFVDEWVYKPKAAPKPFSLVNDQMTVGEITDIIVAASHQPMSQKMKYELASVAKLFANQDFSQATLNRLNNILEKIYD